MRALPECTATDLASLPPDWWQGDTPLVLRGLIAHWPLVQAAAEGAIGSARYLRRFAREGAPPVTVTTAPPEVHGRLFYNEDMTGFNFRREQVPLPVVLNTLIHYLDHPAPPAIYVASTTLDTWLPGLRAANPLPVPGVNAYEPLTSIWIGNRVRVPTHQDLPDNLACVAAGRRRVTLFPPQELRNLYVGPLDNTPAGQPISLVDPAAPDLARFPRFAEAMEQAWMGELAAGDAIFIPSMWWHHMQALDGFNILINDWWRRTEDWMDTPMNVLMYAIMTIRDLPPAQRAIWQDIFRHYVFEADAQTSAHIPEHARGALGAFDQARADRLRERLLARIRRE